MIKVPLVHQNDYEEIKKKNQSYNYFKLPYNGHKSLKRPQNVKHRGNQRQQVSSNRIYLLFFCFFFAYNGVTVAGREACPTLAT